MGFNKDSSISKNEELKSFFTPEFRNRLDAIVEFNPLDHKVVEGIVSKFIDELNIELREKKITISITKEAITYIVKEAYSEEMGARPLKRYIQDNIINQLSDEILFGKLQNGGIVHVTFGKEFLLSYEEV